MTMQRTAEVENQERILILSEKYEVEKKYRNSV